jgi:hypothetical protein
MVIVAVIRGDNFKVMLFHIASTEFYLFHVRRLCNMVAFQWVARLDHNDRHPGCPSGRSASRGMTPFFSATPILKTFKKVSEDCIRVLLNRFRQQTLRGLPS